MFWILSALIQCVWIRCAYAVSELYQIRACKWEHVASKEDNNNNKSNQIVYTAWRHTCICYYDWISMPVLFLWKCEYVVSVNVCVCVLCCAYTRTHTWACMLVPWISSTQIHWRTYIQHNKCSPSDFLCSFNCWLTAYDQFWQSAARTNHEVQMSLYTYTYLLLLKNNHLHFFVSPDVCGVFEPLW